MKLSLKVSFKRKKFLIKEMFSIKKEMFNINQILSLKKDKTPSTSSIGHDENGALVEEKQDKQSTSGHTDTSNQENENEEDILKPIITSTENVVSQRHTLMRKESIKSYINF